MDFDAKRDLLNHLLKKQRRLRREMALDVVFWIVLGGSLGYLATSSIAAAVLAAAILWKLAASNYAAADNLYTVAITVVSQLDLAATEAAISDQKIQKSLEDSLGWKRWLYRG